MKRKTRSVTGTLAYLKRKYVLTYREEKPTVFKIQVVRGGVIGKQDIVAYAANAAHVPETSVQLAMTAFFDASPTSAPTVTVCRWMDSARSAP